MNLDYRSLLYGAVLSPVAIWLAKQIWQHVQSAGTPDQRKKGLKVVITGSSRGLGYALADKFLQAGDSVVISSRNEASVRKAISTLKEKHPTGVLRGEICNVANLDEVEALANKAKESLGRIDIWINNAALSNSTKGDVTEADPRSLEEIVKTNLLGTLWGSRAAIAQMKAQSAGGKVFLIDGTGAWGNPTPKNIAYGATKRALTQLKDSLAAQIKGSKVSVHMASPGMVATQLLLQGIDSSRSAKFINTLAESPETVANWLVPRFRGVQGNGKYFKFLTPAGVLWRLIAINWRKGRFIDPAKFNKKA